MERVRAGEVPEPAGPVSILTRICAPFPRCKELKKRCPITQKTRPSPYFPNSFAAAAAADAAADAVHAGVHLIRPSYIGDMTLPIVLITCPNTLDQAPLGRLHHLRLHLNYLSGTKEACHSLPHSRAPFSASSAVASDLPPAHMQLCLTISNVQSSVDCTLRYWKNLTVKSAVPKRSIVVEPLLSSNPQLRAKSALTRGVTPSRARSRPPKTAAFRTSKSTARTYHVQLHQIRGNQD
jgi:hypothetical protein